jgi:hypothetical protein
MTAGLNLGAPGVYPSPLRAPFEFRPIRLDIAGFVGVALRGPVNQPVQVDSWTDYQRAFGSFESSNGISAYRLLPYAVEAFFAQGGTRAFVVRVAPAGPHTGTDEAAEAATASFRMGPLDLAAADEGSWGNSLSITLGFDVTRRMTMASSPTGLPLPPGADVPVGSLLRLRAKGLPPAGIMRWVVELIQPDASGPLFAVLNEQPSPGITFDCAVITGTLRVDDGDKTIDRAETIGGLGLHPDHPNFAYFAVDASLLIRPVGVWDEPIGADAMLTPVQATITGHGLDRWDEIDFDSFFDESADADPLDEWDRHRGVDAMGRQRQPDIGMLCVPDLDWQWQGPTSLPVGWPPRVPTSGEFEPCATTPDVGAAEHFAVPTRLDPRDPGQLAEIILRQQRVVEVAALRRRFIALLDVPNGIPAHSVLRWRAQFDTSFGAAYHPWLGVPREDDPAHTIVDVPPSSFAAGIIAARENRYGIPWGPANELAATAVVSAASISDAVHDQLHLAGINVYRAERDGFRLTAARTMSSDRDYRQLSIRRLMTMLELTIDRQAQWLVFEPNTPALRRDLSFTVTQMLRVLQREGAFAGATDAESFFVRCDDALNPRVSQELGRLVAEVGVAPAAPLEYLVLRITQDASGRIQVSPPGEGGAT